jgi:hypothetical protein
MTEKELRCVILSAFQLGAADVIYGLISCTGTADAFYNSWIPDGDPRHEASDLCGLRNCYLDRLAKVCGALILETGPGFALYNPR